MIQAIELTIKKLLKQAGVDGDISLSIPPDATMGDLAFGCFPLAKEWKKSPNEIAEDIAQKIQDNNVDIIQEIKSFGPYVNFFFNTNVLSKIILEGIKKNETYGQLDIGKGKKIMVEFGCPNPMKAFHLGHLKNLITGESIVRLMENSGFEVIRANYQGDVGMHIAKSLWGIEALRDEFEAVKDVSVQIQVEFLGKAYAYGAAAYEESEDKKQEIEVYNTKVYEKDPSIQEIYQIARTWSLEYFDEIYDTLNTSFDRFYFESETVERAIEIVTEGITKNIFFESEGAVLFPGSTYGLHDRVYLNSKGFPTYDAKELALSEARFLEFPNLTEVIHVVGKEQSEYFKIVFKAIEALGMKGAGKESHLPGGFLQLKGAEKMSSRTGNIVTGDELLSIVRDKIWNIMDKEKYTEKDVHKILQKITAAALKYTMLKADITKDIAFDLEESVSTSGNSGPYLLYIVARINSILSKVTIDTNSTVDWSALTILAEEKALLLLLARYPQVVKEATAVRDTSLIAKYLFDLAQAFNSFYHVGTIVGATEDTQLFRMLLITETKRVMTKGLWILGIETVESM